MDNIFTSIDNDLTEVIIKHITFDDYLLWEDAESLTEYHRLRNLVVNFVEELNERASDG